MQIQLDINFEQLLQLVKKLPKSQWVKLKSEMDDLNPSVPSASELENFLMNAPTFSEEQLNAIYEAKRKLESWKTE
jgi:hypothetical protein